MANLERVSHTMDSDLLRTIEAVGEAEHRNRSNMIEVLAREALAARGVTVSVSECPSMDDDSTLPRKRKSA